MSMSVYVDDMRMPARVGRLQARWSHLMADTDEELHAFAARLGLKRSWHQKPGTAISHYDVTDSGRQEALRLGAVPIGYMSRESMDLIRRKRERLRAACG
ncbi:Uncharacterised protein [Mycobacteroides abscessus subsp. bolletii]|nr:Uncharacterised protein [Mycobacteroides abscessus]SKF61994.1 Uncharacterised protein [Mycobacteroides abscessus subsp. bolletii]SKH90204.1 Uncharacterised protein [Mycobacteroides abscessus subsp. bolletii]